MKTLEDINIEEIRFFKRKFDEEHPDNVLNNEDKVFLEWTHNFEELDYFEKLKLTLLLDCVYSDILCAIEEDLCDVEDASLLDFVWILWNFSPIVEDKDYFLEGLPDEITLSFGSFDELKPLCHRASNLMKDGETK